MTVQTENAGADRLRELRAAIGTLLPDSDDPHVLSELVVLLAELRRAERVRP